MRKVTLAEVEYIAFQLAKKLMDYNEPIPAFGTRFPHILESCVATPFQRYGGKEVYKGVFEKGAVLFYLMIKNHPFQNGNKRIAVTTLLAFLSKNKRWLKVDEQEFYNFARWVAESNPKLREETVSAIQKFIRTYMVRA